ncbi:MAG: UDP-N-acetylglucosamine 1-carboxyvinyltransferase [Clostridia bacterium]|nr:UDP-N-acetylglucosamine 1-carboxyvinyltransferase [Clostridia bacterium]
MKKIIVCGGRPLNGKISVGGSKNAALPILFACILTNGISKIVNMPDIGDVRVAIEIIRAFGAKVDRFGDTVYIDTRNLSYVRPNPEHVSSIRASTYLIGSCLSRFGECDILPFGGCNFSLRPIDMHIDACISLGAQLDGEKIVAPRLRGAEINFNKASVGATVNAILLAASAEGQTVIDGCAIEPHIDALIDFLNSCGAQIVRECRRISIVGKRLHGGNTRIIGDMIEAGSYLALGLLCGGDLKALDSPIEDMHSVFDAFLRLGASVVAEAGELSVKMIRSKPLFISASPYPGFPTDLQPIFAPLMAKKCGGEIIDEVWPERFGYLHSLSDLGIRWNLNGNRATIYFSEIHCGKTAAPDLRGGMACLMAALCSSGQSEIYSAEVILRGYENLEQKLCAIGADIKIEDI